MVTEFRGRVAKNGANHRKSSIIDCEEILMAKSSGGQMTWLPDGSSSVGMLHLRHQASEPWRPYTEFPEYVRRDPFGFSAGYATFLALLKQQWELF